MATCSVPNQDTSYVDPDAVIFCLKKTLRYKDMCHQVMSQEIIERVAQERRIVLDETEVQKEADRVRRQLRLEKAADTIRWLAEQMVSPDEWEAGIRDSLLLEKLKLHLFDQEVANFFAQNRLDFDQVCLYQIRVPYIQLARELFYQIEESEISFYEAAHLYDVDEQRRLQCGYEGTIYRWHLNPDISALVFAAKEGDVIGPIPTEEGFRLLMVEKFIVAELNATTRQNILNRLFDEWLIAEVNYVIQTNPAVTGHDL